MKNEPIQLTLTIDEINLILEALGALPFAKVFQLISKLQGQAQAALAPGQAAGAPGQAEPAAS